MSTEPASVTRTVMSDVSPAGGVAYGVCWGTSTRVRSTIVRAEGAHPAPKHAARLADAGSAGGELEHRRTAVDVADRGAGSRADGTPRGEHGDSERHSTRTRPPTSHAAEASGAE
jgi:hypothetical protein